MRALGTAWGKVALGAGALVAAAVLGAGCGGSGAQPKDVVLVTHDSFAVAKDVERAFETDTGLQLRILQGGDANETLNKALLTAGDPQGDVIFGIDDSILSRALDGALLDEYRSPELASLEPDFSNPDPHVTPIDHGEVCLNVDRGWFASHDVPPPTSLSDLVLDRYRNLLVVENPATSSPGSRSCSRRSRRSETAGRRTGAACARTASWPSTAGRRRTRSSSPAPRGAPGSARSWSPTRRAPPRR